MICGTIYIYTIFIWSFMCMNMWFSWNDTKFKARWCISSSLDITSCHWYPSIDTKLATDPDVTFDSVTLAECLSRCQDGVHLPGCLSLNYNQDTLVCELRLHFKGNPGMTTTYVANWIYFEKYCGMCAIRIFMTFCLPMLCLIVSAELHVLSWRRQPSSSSGKVRQTRF